MGREAAAESKAGASDERVITHLILFEPLVLSGAQGAASGTYDVITTLKLGDRPRTSWLLVRAIEMAEDGVLVTFEDAAHGMWLPHAAVRCASW